MTEAEKQETKPPVDPKLKLARKAKRLGMSKGEFLSRSEESILATAKAEGWRVSETAAQIADLYEMANDVWTPLAVRFRKVDGGGGSYTVAAYGFTFTAVPSRYGLRIDRDGKTVRIVETIERANIWLNSEEAIRNPPLRDV